MAVEDAAPKEVIRIAALVSASIASSKDLTTEGVLNKAAEFEKWILRDEEA